MRGISAGRVAPRDAELRLHAVLEMKIGGYRSRRGGRDDGGDSDAPMLDGIRFARNDRLKASSFRPWIKLVRSSIAPLPGRCRPGRARAHVRGPQRRGAGGAARRRQDHAGAAGAARCAWARGRKIIVLEPRRLAARAAAERMAQTLGEARRRDRRLPGALRLQDIARDPDRGRHRGRVHAPDARRSRNSTGVAAVLFDEFHERSLDADLGLALARDAQTGLREDLRMLVMSATLDGARVATPARRCAGDRKRRPRLCGRDALSRAQCATRRSSGRWRTRSCKRCAPMPARCWRFCPAPPKFAAPQTLLAERIADPGDRNRAALRRARRRGAGSRHRAGAERTRARSCWRPRSRRPR